MLQQSTLDAVGPAKCIVAGASLRVVKERINNMETLVGWPRSADRDACPLGALACYLVWLNDMSGLNFVSTMFSDLVWLNKNGKANYDPKWRKIYLLHASDPFSPISTTTHNSDYHGIMNAGKHFFTARCSERANALHSLKSAQKGGFLCRAPKKLI